MSDENTTINSAVTNVPNYRLVEDGDKTWIVNAVTGLKEFYVDGKIGGDTVETMTTAERTSITPEAGQLIYDTDEGTLYVGDGETAGGNPVSSGSGGGDYIQGPGIRIAGSTISANTATADEMISGTTVTKLVDANAYRTLNHAEPVVFGGSTASLAANTEFEFCGEMSIRKDDKIQIYFEFSGDFGSVDLIHETVNRGRKYTVTSTAVEVYDVDGNLLYTYDHGLTLDTFANLSIQRRVMPASDSYTTFVKLTLSTLGGSYVNDNFPDYLDFGNFVFESSFAVSNVVANYVAADARKEIWLFGDSYTELISYGWPTYLPFNLLDHIMLGGRSGAQSVNALATLRLLIEKSRPEYIVWAMGINDSDPEGTYNASWKAALDEVQQICSANCVELILVTIPSTPEHNNTKKNEYIHTLNYRVIDFAKALNADTAGATWYEGMLQSDNLHPTPLGAKHLAEAFTQYFADAFFLSDSSVTANQFTGDATPVQGGFGITAKGGTVSLGRYTAVEEVTGYTVTLQAGHAYRAYAATTFLTIKCETIPNDYPPDSYGLDAHLELFVGSTGYVFTSTNVVLSNALEPDSVNNCVIKFHDGRAIIEVTDHIAGYIVVSASGSADGSLPYALNTATQEYISIDIALNGQTLDMAGAVTNGEKHIVGNGYDNTFISGNVSCTSKTTVANLSLQDVGVTGGTLTLGDVSIPSGSTVSVIGGGLAIEKVTGTGSVINLGGTNVIVSLNTTASISGCVFTSGVGVSGGAIQADRATVSIVGSTVTGCTATNVAGAGVSVWGSQGKMLISNSIITGNKRGGTYNGDVKCEYGKLTIEGSTIGTTYLNSGGTATIVGNNALGILNSFSVSITNYCVISSGASIALTSSINPNGTGHISVVGGTCTVNGVTVEPGTYTSIVSSGGSAVINQ